MFLSQFFKAIIREDNGIAPFHGRASKTRQKDFSPFFLSLPLSLSLRTSANSKEMAFVFAVPDAVCKVCLIWLTQGERLFLIGVNVDSSGEWNRINFLQTLALEVDN